MINDFNISVRKLRKSFMQNGVYGMEQVVKERNIWIASNNYPYISQFHYDVDKYDMIFLHISVLSDNFILKTIKPRRPIVFDLGYNHTQGDSQYLEKLEKVDFIEHMRIRHYHPYLIKAIKLMKNLKSLQIVLYDETEDPHGGEEEFALKRPLDLSIFNDSSLE